MRGSFRNYSENFAILAKCENFAIDEIFARLGNFASLAKFLLDSENRKFP